MATIEPAGTDIPDLSGMLSSKDFRAASDRGDLPEGATLALDMEADITKDAESGRRFNFRLTSGRVDRQFDRLKMNGWLTAEFLKNPVWLFAHDTRGTGTHTPQIGVVVELDVGEKAIDVGVEYVPASVNPLAQSVFEMHEFRRTTKALRDRGGAASVGANPIEFQFVPKRGGMDFEKHELLEGSDVIIGANPDALGRVLAAGVDLGPMTEWAEVYRKAAGYVTLDRQMAEAIIKAVDPSKGLALFEMSPAEIVAPVALEVSAVLTDESSIRFAAGAKMLEPEVRRAISPLMAAAGMPVPGASPELQRPDPTDQPEESSLVVSKQSAEPARLTDDEIDRAALGELNRLMIQRTGSPLGEEILDGRKN